MRTVPPRFIPSRKNAHAIEHHPRRPSARLHSVSLSGSPLRLLRHATVSCQPASAAPLLPTVAYSTHRVTRRQMQSAGDFEASASVNGTRQRRCRQPTAWLAIRHQQLCRSRAVKLAAKGYCRAIAPHLQAATGSTRFLFGRHATQRRIPRRFARMSPHSMDAPRQRATPAGDAGRRRGRNPARTVDAGRRGQTRGERGRQGDVTICRFRGRAAPVRFAPPDSMRKRLA